MHAGVKKEFSSSFFGPGGGSAIASQLSADGETLAWVATGSRRRETVSGFRSSARTDARELTGTERAAPIRFWTPDGHDRRDSSPTVRLKRMDIDVRHIADSCRGTRRVSLGGSWSTAETSSSIRIASASSRSPRAEGSRGPPRRSTATRHAENSLRYSAVSPGRTAFRLTSRESGRTGENAAYLELARRAADAVVPHACRRCNTCRRATCYIVGCGNARTRSHSTWRRRGSKGKRFPSPAAWRRRRSASAAAFASSFRGVLTYVPAVAPLRRSLRWKDRAGRDLELAADGAHFPQFRIAPDGRRLAVAINDEARGSRSVWILEPGRPAARLTFPATHDWEPRSGRPPATGLRLARTATVR